MNNLLIVLGFIIIIPSVLMWIFPTRCPKCNKKCKESFYLPGCNDSLYYECSEHGDIEQINLSNNQ